MWDRDHLVAVITLAARPAEKGMFEQLGVETVGFRPAHGGAGVR
jgi:hypothetical protein